MFRVCSDHKTKNTYSFIFTQSFDEAIKYYCEDASITYYTIKNDELHFHSDIDLEHKNLEYIRQGKKPVITELYSYYIDENKYFITLNAVRKYYDINRYKSLKVSLNIGYLCQESINLLSNLYIKLLALNDYRKLQFMETKHDKLPDEFLKRIKFLMIDYMKFTYYKVNYFYDHESTLDEIKYQSEYTQKQWEEAINYGMRFVYDIFAGKRKKKPRERCWMFCNTILNYIFS